MRIELATVEDVPELQEVQRKAFGPQCLELGWEDALKLVKEVFMEFEAPRLL